MKLSESLNIREVDSAVVVPSAPVDGDMDPTATEHDTRFTNPLSAGFDDEKKPASPAGLEKE